VEKTLLRTNLHSGENYEKDEDVPWPFPFGIKNGDGWGVEGLKLAKEKF